MHILVVDSQSILSKKQFLYAEDSLFLCLVKFSNCIDGATLHFSSNEEKSDIRCSIHVSLNGSKVVSANYTGQSCEEAMNVALTLLEPKVARQVYWRSWIDVRAMSTWISPISHWLRWSIGLVRRDTKSNESKPFENSITPNRQVKSSRPTLGWNAKRSDTYSA